MKNKKEHTHFRLLSSVLYVYNYSSISIYDIELM